MKTPKISFMLLILIFAVASCEKKEETDRYGEPVLKVLKNEPAHIVKTCYAQDWDAGRRDTFCVVLLNEYPGFAPGVFPDDIIPAEYRIEGLAIKVSGNVTNRYYEHMCTEPNIRIAPIHIFELKSIKRK